MLRRLPIAAGLCLFLLASVSAEENWTAFQNGGKVSNSPEPEIAFGLSEEIAWSCELTGYGQSSPVVWQGQVYVTSVSGANKETCHIAAFDVSNGEKRWQIDLANATPQESSNYVSKAAPSPAVDEDGLICFFEGGNLLALTHDGQQRWERDLVEEYGEIGSRHGLSASVEQDETSAYVWVERSEAPYVLAVKKSDGTNRWKVEGVGATSWSSPRLVPVEGGSHLVLSAIGSLIGLDPASGERLWTVSDVSGNSTPTPMPLGEGQFLIGATVGRGESDGGNAAASNGVVTISRDGDGWKSEYLWQAKRATSSFSSPIAHQGLAYFVNRTGVLYGLDLETGEERFAERLSGSSWATPLGIGDQLYVFGRDGKIDVVANRDGRPAVTAWDTLPADPEPPAEGAAESVTGSVLYAAALCDNLLLLRRGDRLFAAKVIQK
ncbi:MAG: PQQ-binding-like beta-propeller repeat protein [Planctomycetaceae bacterium]|nr:PQQ-binding-like beta-propeller repeat protein [Planctomycetaceae bacterium]